MKIGDVIEVQGSIYRVASFSMPVHGKGELTQLEYKDENGKWVFSGNSFSAWLKKNSKVIKAAH